jgi:hypothetical protein
MKSWKFPCFSIYFDEILDIFHDGAENRKKRRFLRRVWEAAFMELPPCLFLSQGCRMRTRNKIHPILPSPSFPFSGKEGEGERNRWMRGKRETRDNMARDRKDRPKGRFFRGAL